MFSRLLIALSTFVAKCLEVIEEFVRDAGLTHAGSSTYYQLLRPRRILTSLGNR